MPIPGPSAAQRKITTVAVIDDNRMVRDAIAALLDALPDIRAVAVEVVDPEFVAQMKPHVLLLDVGLADADSLDLAVALKRDAPDAHIIVMDLIPMSEEIRDYVNAGVSGFVLKDATFEQFVHTIRAVADGEKVLPPSMTESLFAQIAKDAVSRRNEVVYDDVRMTRREKEVIELIGNGMSNKEIAERLNLATHTVKSHVRNVMEKLSLHTRLQIAAYCHREEAG